MWNLILPPVIVIVGIGIILWYLSRRMDDPDVLSRLNEARDRIGEISQTRSLSREAFFLKVMEKAASKFKTGTLRMHNFFQQSLERLRKKRVAIDEIRQMIKEEEAEENPESAIIGESSMPEPPKKRSFFARKGTDEIRSEAVMPTVEETVPVDQVIVMPPIEVPSPEEAVQKPILQEKVTKPDHIRERVMRKDAREEMLIARIAENPRDAVSYEELGDHYFSAKNLQDAKACYRQALKLHPTNRAVKIKIRKLEKFFEEGIV